MKNFTKPFCLNPLHGAILFLLFFSAACRNQAGNNVKNKATSGGGNGNTALQVKAPGAGSTVTTQKGNSNAYGVRNGSRVTKHKEEEAGDPDEKGGLNKKALVEGAFKLEFLKTRDAATNTVPKYRLQQAARFADSVKKGRFITSGADGSVAGLTWVERGPSNIGGRTRAILPDLNDATGNTVWAGSVGGGLWKTTNALSKVASPTWKPVNNFFQNLAISCITQNTTNHQLIYFGTGEGWFNGDAIAGNGIWKSADGGATWNQLASTGNAVTGYRFAYNQKILDYTAGGQEYLFACTFYGGLQLSLDGGTSWNQVLGTTAGNAPVSRATDIVRGADGSLYASLGIFDQGGIYKSQDNGATWVALTNGLPTSGYYRIALVAAPSDSLRLYALMQSSFTNSCMGIYRSDSAGRKWYAVTNPGIYNQSNFAGDQAWYALAAAVDPKNADRVIIGGLDLTASQDGGLTWHTISQWYGGGGYQYVHADHHAIVFAGNSDTVFFGNDGGIFATINGKATVPVINQIDSSYNVTQFYHAAIHPAPNKDYLLAGAQDNGNIQFTQAGLNPGNNFTGGDGAYDHIDDDNPNIQIASYVYSNYYVSNDGFVSNLTQVNVNGGSNGRFINPTDYDSRDKILYGADNGGAYHEILHVGTVNNTHITTIPAFGSAQVEAVRVSPNKRHRVFFGLSGETLYMVDNAATNPVATRIDNNAFTSAITGAYLSCIAVEPGNDNHLLVCFSNFGLTGKSIFETKDGGATWASVAGNLPDMPIRSICFAPYSNSSAIIGTDLGVWATDLLAGAGTVWVESNTGLARVSADWVDYRKSDGTLFAATHGRGLFTSTSFKKPVVSYVRSDTTFNRTNATSAGGADCRTYYDMLIPVQLSSAPSVAAQVSVAASSNTLVKGVDYDLLTTGNLTFSAAGTQNVKVRIYNTPEPLAADTIVVALSLVNGGGTNAIVTPFPDFNSYTIFINNQQSQTLPVQTAVDTLGAGWQYVGGNRTAYFYEGSPGSHLIASVTNNSATPLGCLKLAVDRAGNNANVPFNSNDTANYLASKTIKLFAANTAASGLSYSVTLYYSNAEVATWAAGSGRKDSALGIVGIKNRPISAVTPSGPHITGVFAANTTRGVYNGTNYSFTTNFTAIDSLVGFGIGDTTVGTLPVTLISFAGSLVKGNTVLTWKTATEINNKGFEVQRSSAGAAFTPIGFVNGKGTTSLLSNYTFTDNALPADEVLYYRLKQVDLDGRAAYSKIITITKPAGADEVLVTENPLHGRLNLAFRGNLAGTATVSVFDMSGKKVYTSSQNVQSALQLNINNVGSGVYLVSVLWHDKRYTFKVVKN